MYGRMNRRFTNNRPNFTLRWFHQQNYQQQTTRALNVPPNRFNVFTDIMRIYGHNCFHLRNLTKTRAMLYAHVYDSNREKLEEGIRTVVADATEFAEAVAEDRADIAIEVLYIAAHLCERYKIDNSSNFTKLVSLQCSIFNHQMNFYRRRAWMMSTEEKIWVKRYSISRFFSFLNVILPEIATGGGMDNLYPYVYDGDDSEELIPFLSNVALTSNHLAGLDYFLANTKLVFEFRSSFDVGVIPLPADQDEVLRWPFPVSSRALAPIRGGFEFDDPFTEPIFDDYYARPQPLHGPTRSVPKDIEYRCQITVHQSSRAANTGDDPLPAYNNPSLRDTSSRTPFSHNYRVPASLGCVRFVDYPVKTPLTYTTALGLACQASHPGAVKVLLKHGATPFFNDRSHRNNHVLQCLEEPFGIVARILNRGRAWRNCRLETISRETLSRLIGWEIDEERRMVEILQLMLRAVPNFPIKFFTEAEERSSVFISEGAIKDPESGQMTFQLHERFRECVSPDSASGVPSLKAICRSTIRETLLSNWNVVHGIYKLPLPRLLQDYLALEM